MTQRKRHTVEEVSKQIEVAPDVILKFVLLEWIIPADPFTRSLDEEDIARARLIYDLQRHFAVNDEAIPIILHLIDQLNRTHLEIKKRG